MSRQGLDQHQWRIANLHLRFLADELSKMGAWLEEDLEKITTNPSPVGTPERRAENHLHDTLHVYAKHIREHRELLTALLNKLKTSHAFDGDDDSFWQDLMAYEEEAFSAYNSLPPELRAEIERD